MNRKINEKREYIPKVNNKIKNKKYIIDTLNGMLIIG